MVRAKLLGWTFIILGAALLFGELFYVSSGIVQQINGIFSYLTLNFTVVLLIIVGLILIGVFKRKKIPEKEMAEMGGDVAGKADEPKKETRPEAKKEETGKGQTNG